MRTNQMITKDPPKGKRFDLLAILSIGHFRVPKTLTTFLVKMSFIWMSSISNAEHLTSF